MSDQKKFRISLWEVDTTLGALGGWRGAQKAVVFDAANIGVEEYANDTGSAYWTLENSHPQISEFIPLARHYEISRWSETRNRWEFVAAGILDNYSATDYETTFQGIDYKSVLNQSYTPLSGMKTGGAGSLSTLIGVNGITTASSIPFKMSETSVGTQPRYFNTGAFGWDDSPVVTAFPGTLRALDPSELSGLPDGTNVYINNYANYINNTGDWTYYESPMISLTWSSIWNGGTASTGFNTNAHFRIYASPPANKNSGSPALTDLGLIGELEDNTQFSGSGTTIVAGQGWGPYTYNLYPQELKTLVESIEGPGSFTGFDYIATDYTNAGVSNEQDIACLRPGVSYSFQIYAAVWRTATAFNTWYRSKDGTIMGSEDTTSLQYGLPYEVTLGQSDEDAYSIIKRSLYNSIEKDEYSRLRYSSLISSGSTATTHTTISAAQPVLDYIADICDLEMGAKTTGDKVIFGIKKPSGGATYDGDFQLNLSVSSSPSTAMALRYPETISSFSFDPGYSRVRNDVKIIPSTSYLSGSSGQNPSGVSLIGASAINQSSISTNGRIPAIVSRDGLLNQAAAQNEANRLINTSKIENTKNVSISAVVNGIDLWNGWDLGDSINVTIKKGLVDINEPFVISGVRWFGETDGHERIELELVQGTAFGAQFSAPSGGTSATTLGR